MRKISELAFVVIADAVEFSIKTGFSSGRILVRRAFEFYMRQAPVLYSISGIRSRSIYNIII